MDIGRVSDMDLGHSVNRLSEAIRDLSKQLQEFQQASREESERLGKYKEESTLLDFILVTGGLINGKVLWIGNQSLGIRADSDQDIILYKHAVAFIQQQAE